VDENPYESPKTPGKPAQWPRSVGCGVTLLVVLALIIAINLCHVVVSNLPRPNP
jgi:hypothetical protein